MIIGDRLRTIRESKKLSQGDIEKRTGLLRCYISRVENGHTVPAIETLEKMARALDMHLYEVLWEPDIPLDESLSTRFPKSTTDGAVLGKAPVTRIG